MKNKAESLTIRVSEHHSVSALLERPREAWAMYVLAHGAGTGMHHEFLESVSGLLSGAGIATLRFQFPYTEAGGRWPDPPLLLESTVRAAVGRAAREELPLFAGGKSMGGRMTSQAQAQEVLAGVRGLVFLGFPLHPPKQPSVARAKHLDRVTTPMLFVQGTRDTLADLDLMRGVCAALGSRAVLHLIDTGDHSFKVLKRSGRTQDQVMEDIRDTMAGFMRTIIEKAAK